MTSSELRRKLLYCGYSDVTDYLRNSPLNRHIYKKLLNLLQNHCIEVPIVAIFNEVYYVCVRVRFDSKPGVDVGRRYIPDVEVALGNNLPAAQVVFCLVWVLLKLKNKLSFHEECFVEQLSPYINNSDFHDEAVSLLDELMLLGYDMPDEFPTMTSPFDELPIHYLDDEKPGMSMKRIWRSLMVDDDMDLDLHPDVEAWIGVTDNFSHSTIEAYLPLFTRPDDQIGYLESVRWACVHGPQKDRRKNEEFIRGLRQNLFPDNFKTVLSEKELLEALEAASADAARSFEDDDGDLRLGMAREKFLQEHPDFEDSDETTEEKAERLERACDYLRKQREEQRQSYEKRIKELEEKYQCEIDDLKDRLECAGPVADANSVDSAPQELSFTVTELVEYAKVHFEEATGKEASTMLMRLALRHHNYEEEIFQLIDSIESAIKEQNKPQHHIHIPEAAQVNINPNQVDNHFKE
jgi:hypothetical protein